MCASYNPHVVKDGSIIGEVHIRTFLHDSKPALEYFYDSNLTGVISGDDYFDMLWRLRLIFQEVGIDIFCEGSLITVFPGGLASDQSFSEIAYKYYESDGGFRQVNIFSNADDDEINLLVGREAQKEARRKLIRSRRGSE